MSRPIKFVNKVGVALSALEQLAFADLENNDSNSGTSVYVIKHHNQTSKIFIDIKYTIFEKYLMFGVKLVPVNNTIEEARKRTNLLHFGIAKERLTTSYARYVLDHMLNSGMFPQCNLTERDFPILFPTVDLVKESQVRFDFFDSAHFELLLRNSSLAMEKYKRDPTSLDFGVNERYLSALSLRITGANPIGLYYLPVRNDQLADTLTKKLDAGLSTTIVELIGDKSLDLFPQYHKTVADYYLTFATSVTVQTLRDFRRNGAPAYIVCGSLNLDDNRDAIFINNYIIDLYSPSLSPDDIVKDALVVFCPHMEDFPVEQDKCFKITNAIDHLRCVTRRQSIELANNFFEEMKFRPRNYAENIKKIAVALRCMHYTQHTIAICQDAGCFHSSVTRRNQDCHKFKIEFFDDFLLEKDSLTFCQLLAYSHNVVVAVHYSRAVAI